MILREKYNQIRPIKKRDFDINNITDTLMENSIDISEIVHTPDTVIVKLPREEYISKGIGNIISRIYKVKAICKDDMLIFHNAD